MLRLQRRHTVQYSICMSAGLKLTRSVCLSVFIPVLFHYFRQEVLRSVVFVCLFVRSFVEVFICVFVRQFASGHRLQRQTDASGGVTVEKFYWRDSSENEIYLQWIQTLQQITLTLNEHVYRTHQKSNQFNILMSSHTKVNLYQFYKCICFQERATK